MDAAKRPVRSAAPESEPGSVARTSKAHPRRELKGTWAARTEDIRDAARGLAEGCAGQITAMAGKIGRVVNVECLTNE